MSDFFALILNILIPLCYLAVAATFILSLKRGYFLSKAKVKITRQDNPRYYWEGVFVLLIVLIISAIGLLQLYPVKGTDLTHENALSSSSSPHQ